MFARWFTQKAAIMAACSVMASGAAVSAQVIWQNTRNMPDDLINSQDAWTAARVNERGAESWRIAADDVVIETTVRIKQIVFYGVSVGDPIVVGGDWYVYAGGGDTPGELLYAGDTQELTREDTGWVSPTFGPIYRNILEPEDLVLEPGHYFFAFRSTMSCPGGNCPGKYAIFTTRWANGRTRALWNFGVLGNGDVIDRWMLMEEFNLIRDQEWAFELIGEGNCDAIRKFTASCRNGTLKVKVKSSLEEGSLLTVDNDGDRRQIVINRRGIGKAKYRGQQGTHTVSLVECPDFSREVECR